MLIYTPASSRAGEAERLGDRCGEPRLGEADLDWRRGDWERDLRGERDWLRLGERENLQQNNYPLLTMGLIKERNNVSY